MQYGHGKEDILGGYAVAILPARTLLTNIAFHGVQIGKKLWTRSCRCGRTPNPVALPIEEFHNSPCSGYDFQGLNLLKKITLLRDRVQDWNDYPFSIAVIRNLNEVDIRNRICFFAGENGTGKSTLLEAIAAHYGFGPEGGNRSFSNDSTDSNHSIDPLVRALRLSFDNRTGAGFFLRAESFFNTATHIDRLDAEPGFGPPISLFYGGQSLHTRSHGETFFTVLELKFQRNGLFLLDEPEAALSPQRQLGFLVLIHDVLRKYKDAQFIISTHSPVLLGYPEAQIISFDGERLQEIKYEDTAPMQIVRRFLNDRENFLQELFKETPNMFERD
jgi:predicted ATPase